MHPWILIGMGGAIGAIARYVVSSHLAERYPTWVVGTLVVNVVGSFLFGVIYVLMLKYAALADGLKFGLLVGFLGAFTTFSTFSFETVTLLKEGSTTLALTMVALNVLLSIAAVAVGIQGAQWCVK